MGFVKAHDELMIGDKRALKRATRFVFLEICKEARPFGGRLPLPRRGDVADCVHDVLGGNRDEVAEAMSELLDPDDPMLELEALEGGRRALVVPSWGRWNPNDATAPARMAKLRASRKNGSIGNVTAVTTVTLRPVTTGRVDKRRSLTPEPSVPTPFGGKPEEPPPPTPAAVVDLPLPYVLTETLPMPYAAPPKPQRRKPRQPETECPPTSAPDVTVDAWLESQGLPKFADAGPELRQFVDHHRARGNVFRDWLAAWRMWERNALKFQRAGPRGAVVQPVPETGREWELADGAR